MPLEIIFYYSKGSNCSERVKWVLDYKQIEYQLIDADLHYGTREYLKINPFGRVPSMIADGVLINESMVMIELLEESYSQNPLFPKSALEKAKVKQVCEVVNSTVHPVQNSNVVKFFKPDLSKKEINDIRVKWISKNLKILSGYLWKQSKFLVASDFSLADIYVSVIYNKGVLLGMHKNEFPQYEEHFNYLKSIDKINESCPI